METYQVEVESQAVELATQAFKAFCGEISGMFGVDMECERREIAAETVAGLQKRFINPVAVNIVDSEGALSGTFQFVFDQEGLFILGGITTMQSEQMILANRNDASPELAVSMVNAMGEAGNLLVDSWDRVFRERLDGHSRFTHRLPALVGSPWERPEEMMGLAGDQELVYISYQMTIGSYPAFDCDVIFPKTIFRESSDFVPEQAALAGQNNQEVTEENPQEVTGQNAQDMQTDAGDNAEQAQPEQNPQDITDTQEAPAAQESVAGESQLREPEASSDQQNDAATENAADSPAEETPVAFEKGEETATGEVSEAIQKIAKSPAVLPGGSGDPAMTKNAALINGEYLQICARDIMQKNVLRAAPDESLQQALAKMRQTDAGYIMIERDGVLEGIVSKSDITGAMSPYLQPIFSKWRRPLDDATLKIRIKWVMSRPVRTIKPQTSLAAMVKHMSQFRGRCLAVTDEAGKVQGLVTAFDIFEALLKGRPSASAAGETERTPAEPAALTEST